jgi:PST family polysaccharide transporter
MVLGGVCYSVSNKIAILLRMPALAPVLRALALMYPLRGLGLVAEAVMQRALRFRALSAIDVASYGVGYGAVGITLALAGYGVWALVAAQLGQTAVRTLLLVVSAPHSWRLSLHRGALMRLLNYGSGLTFAQLANALAVNVDNLIVGRWIGAGPLALYSRAYQLLVMPASLFSSVLDRVLFPVMSRLRADRLRLGHAYLQAIEITASTTLPAGATLVVLAPEVIRVLLGPNWDGAVLPLRILAGGMMFRASFQLGDSLARAMGAVYASAWRQAAYAGAVIAGAWIGHYWGIGGVAVGVLLALAVKYGMMAQQSLRLTGGSWRQFGLAHSAAFLVTGTLTATAGAVAYACRAATFPPVATLATALFAMLLAAAALLLLAPTTFLVTLRGWLAATLAARSSLVVRMLARTSSPWRALADTTNGVAP